MTDHDPAPVDATPPAHSASSRLFDLRTVIAVLFGAYGLVLLLMGLLGTDQADLDKAGGIQLNLWTGVAMLVLAALFLAWALLRPLRPPADHP